jgi:hypothetical protein
MVQVVCEELFVQIYEHAEAFWYTVLFRIILVYSILSSAGYSYKNFSAGCIVNTERVTPGSGYQSNEF